MITNYIQELLATNNRVIIPNYGAFLVRATSKGKDSNNLEEKLSDIYFSPFLKFNDELLERFIIKKEGITKEQAAEKIKIFIEEIKEKLTSESAAYDIKRFGQFTMDKQGKVIFTPVEVEKAEIKPAEVVIKEEPKTTKKAAGKPEKEPVKKTTVKEKARKEPEKEIVSEIKSEQVKKEEIRPEIKSEIKAPVSPPKLETKYISKKKEPSSVNKGLVWSIAIGLPLAAIFIWALLNFDTINKVLKKEKKQQVKTEKIVIAETEKEIVEPVVEEIQVEEQQTTESVIEPVSVETKAVSSQGKYYIIAGSFKNEAYAESYLKSLREKGYPAEKLAERNGMHAISFSSFTDEKEALAEYKVITQEKGLTAWILYY